MACRGFRLIHVDGRWASCSVEVRWFGAPIASKCWRSLSRWRYRCSRCPSLHHRHRRASGPWDLAEQSNPAGGDPDTGSTNVTAVWSPGRGSAPVGETPRRSPVEQWVDGAGSCGPRRLRCRGRSTRSDGARARGLVVTTAPSSPRAGSFAASDTPIARARPCSQTVTAAAVTAATERIDG